jgi:serine O-acetyltransferase
MMNICSIIAALSLVTVNIYAFKLKRIRNEKSFFRLEDNSNPNYYFEAIKKSAMYDATYTDEKSDERRDRVFSLINSFSDSEAAGDFISPLWETLRYEATNIAESDFKAAMLMTDAILSHSNLQESIIDLVANKLETPLLQATQVKNIFNEACEIDPSLPYMWFLDILATVLRDTSQANAVSVLLFNQGFHSLVAYRVANVLWYNCRDGLGRFFQSLVSRRFGADIHPACSIGHSCVLSSGTGIVIGETAVVGNDCTLSHGITLGGTGKESGDRHPKLGDGVFLGAGATVLGNIRVGDGAVVDAGSVVTKPVLPFTRVSGVPAILVARFAVDGKCVANIKGEKIFDDSVPIEDFPSHEKSGQVMFDGEGNLVTTPNKAKTDTELKDSVPNFVIDYQGKRGIGT